MFSNTRYYWGEGELAFAREKGAKELNFVNCGMLRSSSEESDELDPFTVILKPQVSFTAQ